MEFQTGMTFFFQSRLPDLNNNFVLPQPGHETDPDISQSSTETTLTFALRRVAGEMVEVAIGKWSGDFEIHILQVGENTVRTSPFLGVLSSDFHGGWLGTDW